ncbi:50S ribosomal protein L29 [bacterium CPR1]|nr:50S ribosomal protein L29 [bacterium CPR1]
MKSNIKKLQESSLAELTSDLKGAQEELFNLRFQIATQRLTDNSQIKKTRKKIAQLHTVIRQKELTGKKEG